MNNTDQREPGALTAVDTAALELTLGVGLKWCREI